MQGRKITKEQWDKFLKALEESMGIVSVACKKVNIGRPIVYIHRKEDNEFAKAIDNIVDNMGIPLAHDRLIDAIEGGEFSAIKYYLQTKGGKEWRITEGREHTGNVKSEVMVNTSRDVNRLKAKRAYEKAEQDTIYRRTSERRQLASVGDRKEDKEREGEAD